MNEKEILEFLNNYKDYDCNLREYETCLKCENKVRNAIQGLLDLYKKKSRIVEIMAEHLTTDIHGKDWVIKYFEDEVELEKEEE